MRWLESVSKIVPPARRPEWMAEWQAELWQLGKTHPAGTWRRLRFLAGALPHALWERKEEWSMESLWMDVRYAVRTLGRSPGFVLVAVVAIALGVGANTSIFTLVNGVLLRPPAGIENPQELVQIGRGRSGFDNFSFPAFEVLRAESRTVDVAAWARRSVVVGAGSRAVGIAADLVSGNYFEVLGVAAARGRGLTPADAASAAEAPVAVLSDALWRSRFGSDPGIIGRVIRINRRGFEVVGVLPPGFGGAATVAAPPSLFLPIEAVGALDGREPAPELLTDKMSWLWLLGRPRGGASLERIEAEMQSLAGGLPQQVLPGDSLHIRVAAGVGLRPDERQEAGTISILLLVVVGLVLLATCANLAGVFIARATRRVGEVSVRMAMGAGRLRLFRQLITESTLLSLAGAVLAVPLTYWAAGVLPSVVPFPLTVSLEPDLRVLIATLGAGLVAGVLFGLAPALQACRVDLNAGLRENARTGSGRAARGRAVLVVAQLAVAMALLSATGLLLRSVQEARRQGAGFETERLHLIPVNLRFGRGYSAETGAEFLRQRIEELEFIPGVSGVAVANTFPISPFQPNGSVSRFPEAQEELLIPDTFVVSPSYFETLGLRIVRGSWPESGDGAEAIVNEALAARLWPGGDAVGQSLATALQPDEPYQVAAVVADVRHRSLQLAGRPTVYLPLSRRYSENVVFHLRVQGAGEGIQQQALTVLETADPELPLGPPTDASALADASLAQPRLIGWLTAGVSLLALALGAVGLGGLIASSVARRRREMGIRMALGATRGDVLRLVVGWGLAVTAAGLVAGVGAALALGQLLEGVLFGIGSTDAAVLIAGGAVLLVVALVAAAVPARLAARTDPIETLRAQ